MPRRHGSLQFRPRKRARTQKATFRSYPELEIEKPKLVAFPGYKVGMVHVYMKEDRPGKLLQGQYITLASTVVESPPIKVIGIRAYKGTPYGLKPVTTALNINLEEDSKEKEKGKEGEAKDKAISRLPLTMGKKVKIDNLSKTLPKIEESLPEIKEIRVLAYTRPDLAGIHKKKPELLEIPVKGASIGERFEYAKSLIGEEVSVFQVFKVGQLVDVTAVTKGHGWQGVVRRFGVELLRHKAGKGRWRVGSLGSRHPPYVTWRVPRAGQTGYHKRTEYNKRILLMADPADKNSIDITPKGGFKNYGILKTHYMLLSGSIPGPAKRFVMIRDPIRPIYDELPAPEISYISSIGWLKR